MKNISNKLLEGYSRGVPLLVFGISLSSQEYDIVFVHFKTFRPPVSRG